MAVYVDDASIPATVPNGRARHTSRWSHLFADTQDELHAFAERLGLRRSYFQPGKPRGDGSPSPFWHYDVTAGKRQQALRLGAQPVAWRDASRIMREREARAERARVADQASHAAGLAYLVGDYVKASQLLSVAREADPGRSALWAEHQERVRAAARAQAAQVAGPDDPRPLPAIVRARLEAAGIGADDQAVRFVRTWNAERMAAAAEAEPGPADEPRPAAEPSLSLLSGAQREAGS
jgi:hypothetical protein